MVVPRMSDQRRRGLLRLVILLGSLVGLVILGFSALGGGSSGSHTSSTAASGRSAPARLTATVKPLRMPVALHGDAVMTRPTGLLVVGGELADGTSTDHVYSFDPLSGRIDDYGTLAQPLHDAAAAMVRGRPLVFGGGNTATLDMVQALSPSSTATQVGHLPTGLSDLAAVPLAGAAYVIGGFNGQNPDASVLQTVNGAAFERVARLPTPVRYAATATIGDKIYTFGGELADGTETNEIQEYDLGTEKAVIAGHLPDPLSHAAAVEIGGAIYLLGGRIRGAASDKILRFDPGKNVMSPAGRLPEGVYDGAAGTFQGRGYLLGGLGSSGSSLNTVIELR
jgi:Kelch motif protein